MSECTFIIGLRCANENREKEDEEEEVEGKEEEEEAVEECIAHNTSARIQRRKKNSFFLS